MEELERQLGNQFIAAVMQQHYNNSVYNNSVNFFSGDKQMQYCGTLTSVGTIRDVTCGAKMLSTPSNDSFMVH